MPLLPLLILAQTAAATPAPQPPAEVAASPVSEPSAAEQPVQRTPVMVVTSRVSPALSPGPSTRSALPGATGEPEVSKKSIQSEPAPYRVFGEVFARYAHEKAGTQDARSFDLPRSRLGVDALLGEYLAARALLETVRSASPGSLYGVEGDSIVVRAREVYGEARTPDRWAMGVRVRLGLIPTLAITPLEQMWGRRVVAPTAQEASGALSPADLGAAALVRLPAALGEVAVAVVNGEGFTQHEQNRGKTVQARAWLTPLDAWLPDALSVRLLAHVEDGSVGPAQARADRALVGLAVEHRLGAIGADGTFVEGVQGASGQHGRTASAWARVGPFQGAEVLGRVDQIDPDRRHSGGDDRVTTWQAGVGYHAPTLIPSAQAFEVYLTYRHSSAGSLATAADPQLPRRGLRLDLRVAF